MKTVTLQTESFLFQNAEGQFRAIPFYELSIEEWVIFENGEPKYFLDFNRRTQPLIEDLMARLNKGERLEEAIESLGRFLGRQWTIKHNIEGDELPNSQQTEVVTVTLLDNLAELFMDVYFVATNTIDTTILMDEDKFIRAFVDDVDEPGFETAYAANKADFDCMLALIFGHPVNLIALALDSDRVVYDVTNFRQYCITVDELELRYEDWVEESKGEGSMTQYGIMMSVVSYINNNADKENLLVVTERRKHW